MIFNICSHFSNKFLDMRDFFSEYFLTSFYIEAKFLESLGHNPFRVFIDTTISSQNILNHFFKRNKNMSSLSNYPTMLILYFLLSDYWICFSSNSERWSTMKIYFLFWLHVSEYFKKICHFWWNGIFFGFSGWIGTEFWHKKSQPSKIVIIDKTI